MSPAYLAAVVALAARPFPAREVRDGDDVSGPGHHVLVLRRSRDFWDADLDEILTCEAEFAGLEQELDAGLSACRGRSEALDLGPYLFAEGVPRPWDSLSNVVGLMRTWLVAGRRVGIGIGQHDREFGLMLMAVVAGSPELPEVEEP